MIQRKDVKDGFAAGMKISISFEDDEEVVEVEAENHVANVDGKITRLDAKIAGITPDIFSFNGKCVAWF